MHFKKNVRISDGVLTESSGYRTPRGASSDFPRPFVMDLPVDLFGCSIFNKMALWLLNSPIIVVEIRRQTKRQFFTSPRNQTEQWSHD
jgi:hypothetical protein